MRVTTRWVTSRRRVLRPDWLRNTTLADRWRCPGS